MDNQWKEQILEYQNTRRKEIIEVSLKLFIENGVNNVKLNDIVKSCGISKVTLYKYFNSVDEIFFAVQKLAIKEIMSEVNSSDFSGNNAIEKIKLLLNNIIDIVERKQEYLKFIGFFYSRYYDNYPTAELKKEYASYLIPDTMIYEDLLIEGMEDGSIRSDLDVKLLSLSIVNIMIATMHRMKLIGAVLKETQGNEPRLIFQEVVNIIINYLEP